MFSRTAEYALRALARLASQPPGKLTSAKSIARAEQIPMPFLWKILQLLAHRRLIRSFKGVRGGYELALPPDQISLLSILQALDLDDSSERCALGLPECSEESPCSLHYRWKGIRGNFVEFLQRNTLSDLVPARSGLRAADRRFARKHSSLGKERSSRSA